MIVVCLQAGLKFMGSEIMKVKFHGVRGSVPVSGPAFAKFGGHTTCIEVSTPSAQVIIDAGSGFQNVPISPDRPVVLLLSHFHHDHIQGFAFNRELFHPASRVFVTSALCGPAAVRAHLQAYFSGAYFPVDLLASLPHLRFIDFQDITTVIGGDLCITTIPLRHPGGCSAYKIATSKTRLCCLLDNEYDTGQQANLDEFCHDADLMVWDGMFRADELVRFTGWGHSSIEQGIAFLQASTCRRLAITHHAPGRTDAQLQSFQQEFTHPGLSFAHQTQVIEL
jgi:phosphoribosyl 1,2-cyclic phosphodiesterase